MRKTKKIIYWCVKGSANPNILLTVTDTKAEAEEFINKLIYENNKQKFDSWCYFRNIKEEDKPTAWLKYYDTVVETKEKFSYWYQKVSYTKAELAAIVRMFCSCKSLGCSYELKEEIAYSQSKQQIKDMMTEKFMELLKEQPEEDGFEVEESEEELVQ